MIETPVDVDQHRGYVAEQLFDPSAKRFTESVGELDDRTRAGCFASEGGMS